MKKFSYDVTEPHVSMDSLELYEIIVDPDDCKCHMCLVLNQLISEIQDQGVDPNLRDIDGATPLHFAASRGHVDTVRWLLRHGGRLTLDKYGKSPINDAAENQQVECLNILVQHGTIPDYHEDNDKGRIIGCTCRKGDLHQKCSYSDCVNLSCSRAPFYLHSPTRADCPTHDGLYINQMSHTHETSHGESFFLHNPREVVYNRVKDLFDGVVRNEATSENGMIVKVEVHSSSSGAGSEENLSSSDMSERSDEQEHDYEDIYHLREVNVEGKNGSRSRSRDSGSHSRSGSVSSTNSGGIVVKLTVQDQPSMTPSTESGVSSASPSDIGHSEEEADKLKIPVRFPHQSQTAGGRQLKRTASEPPVTCPPPPPPPLPIVEKTSTMSRRCSTVESSSESNVKDARRPVDSSDNVVKDQEEGGAKSNEDIVDFDGSGTAIPTLVNRQLVLPSFIPPKFSVTGENCLIKPSEYLKSIGGSRTIPFLDATGIGEKQFTKCSDDKSSALEESKLYGSNNGPPPPPLPSTHEKESQEPNVTTPKQQEGDLPKMKKPQQPLSAISIQDLHSVQLKRTVVHKTMSTPAKSPASGTEPFQSQKQDLIAELKLSKDIEGVRKMKVERLKSEVKQEKELVSEISKQLTANNLLEKIPERDATGNPIPPWKRQMLAKKAAEKARKDLEEQMKREAEEKRIQSIPAWKRQLLAKKEENELRSVVLQPKVEDKKTPQILVSITDGENCTNDVHEENNKENSRPTEKENEPEDETSTTQIIPWRAQLRKTNSKLSLLD
ncbi:hypothetical protein RUM43_014759 [Polyplax serrata]|uniref:Uncharacterized protein n=1 Tax=Polyplax serrata TaxID=468196 RepID=A0AAN8P0T6_POLSC